MKYTKSGNKEGFLTDVKTVLSFDFYKNFCTVSSSNYSWINTTVPMLMSHFLKCTALSKKSRNKLLFSDFLDIPELVVPAMWFLSWTVYNSLDSHREEFPICSNFHVYNNTQQRETAVTLPVLTRLFFYLVRKKNQLTHNRSDLLQIHKK